MRQAHNIAPDSERSKILYDEEARKYFVSLKAICAAVEQLKLPMPDLDEAGVAFGRDVRISGFELAGTKSRGTSASAETPYTDGLKAEDYPRTRSAASGSSRKRKSMSGCA